MWSQDAAVDSELEAIKFYEKTSGRFKKQLPGEWIKVEEEDDSPAEKTKGR